MTAHCQSGEVHDHFCRSTNVDDIAHKGEIDFVHEVAYEAKLAKLQAWRSVHDKVAAENPDTEDALEDD